VKVFGWPRRETDIADALVPWLTDQGWDVYQEVGASNSSRADVVALRGPLIWIVELKTTFSLELLAQAENWLGRAHYVSVATPHGRRSRGCRGFAESVCRRYGIGSMLVSEATEYSSPVLTTVAPAFHRRIDSRIRDFCVVEAKNFAKAGNADGKFWSPFKSTCVEIRRVVEERPGVTLRELMQLIKHHYQTDASARGAIPKWVEKGVVPGVETRREGRSLRFYPTGALDR
jgi:hypothetical protein